MFTCFAQVVSVGDDAFRFWRPAHGHRQRLAAPGLQAPSRQSEVSVGSSRQLETDTAQHNDESFDIHIDGDKAGSVTSGGSV
jgi:hypothetical protein